MTVRISDPVHGHHAVFYAPNASPSAASDVTWGPDSIEVPSQSCLNGTADVWLKLPSSKRELQQRAIQWCERTNVAYLGALSSPDESTNQYDLGFGFRVPHFSRFRFNDEPDDSDEQDPQMQQSPQPSSSTTTTLTEDEMGTVRQARLRRAGSTPARPRVGTAIRQSKQQPRQSQSQSQRPRLSIRSVPDLDDTDPDLDDDDASFQTHPPPHQEQKKETSVIDDVAVVGPPVRNHRMLTFEDENQGNQWQSSTNSSQYIDAPSVHRLRDALFTPSTYVLNTKAKQEASLISNDIDMADIQSNAVTPNNAKYDGVMKVESDQSLVSDDINKAEDDIDDEQEELIRFAEEQVWSSVDHEDEEDIENDEDNYVIDDNLYIMPEACSLSVLPFPSIQNSITSDKQGLYDHIQLALGRSMKISFSSSNSQVLAPSFNASHGFSTIFGSLHASVNPLPRQAYSRMLNAHCATWYAKYIRNESEQIENNAEADFHGRRGQLVRKPTLNMAFMEGKIADSVLLQMIEILSNLYDVFNDSNALHGSIVFGLLLALYKSSHEDDEAETENIGNSPYSNGLLFRLTEWIGNVAGNAFDDDEIDDVHGLRKAVIALSIGKIDKAIEIAIELGYYRLAMLISRALETPKDELRNDAEAQLEMYGLRVEQDPVEGNSDNSAKDDDYEDRKSMKWDRILNLCEEEANVNIDERMILLILSGHVSSVARYLKFSWYRLFSMELQYGSGSTFDNEIEWQKISKAIESVDRCKMSSTIAPHGETDDMDVCFQLLKLYTENGSKLQLMSKLYCNSSFGFTHQSMDFRFTWLLYQILAALIPEASANPKFACMSLADGLAAQLKSLGMPLWSFYVLCSGNGHIDTLKNTLLNDWNVLKDDFVHVKIGKKNSQENGNANDDDMIVEVGVDQQHDDDNSNGENNASNFIDLVHEEPNLNNQKDVKMEAEEFLTTVLGVPNSWIHEAKAISLRLDGKHIEECEEWLLCETDYGSLKCHDILMKHVVPKAIVSNDKTKLHTIMDMLMSIEERQNQQEHKQQKSWSYERQLVLGYLKHVVGIPQLIDCELDTLRKLANYVKIYMGQGHNSNLEKCTATIMADGIITCQRSLLMRVNPDVSEIYLMPVLADLEDVPCSKAVRLRLAAEYTLVATHGWHNAQRIAAAFPPYRKYIEALGDKTTTVGDVDYQHQQSNDNQNEQIHMDFNRNKEIADAEISVGGEIDIHQQVIDADDMMMAS